MMSPPTSVIMLPTSVIEITESPKLCASMLERGFSPDAITSARVGRAHSEMRVLIPIWKAIQKDPIAFKSRDLLLDRESVKTLNSPSGGVMANIYGRQLLQGNFYAHMIAVVEGETDLFALETVFNAAHLEIPIFGVAAGLWSPEIAACIPVDFEVFILVDQDVTGDRYAQKIGLTLSSHRIHRLLDGGADIADRLKSGTINADNWREGCKEWVPKPEKTYCRDNGDGSAFDDEERGREYFKKALKNAIAEIEDLKKGERYDRLNKIAFMMGGLLALPGAPNLYSVRDALTTAAIKTGLTKSEAKNILKDPLSAGLRKNPKTSLPTSERGSYKAKEDEGTVSKTEIVAEEVIEDVAGELLEQDVEEDEEVLDDEEIKPEEESPQPDKNEETPKEIEGLIEQIKGPPYDPHYDDWNGGPYPSQTAMAKRMLDTYERPAFVPSHLDKDIISCGGHLWRTDDQSLWIKITRHEIVSRLQRWDGADLGKYTLKLQNPTYSQILDLAVNGLKDDQADFFDGSPKGFACRDKFFRVDLKSGTISVGPLKAEYRQRHAIDAEIPLKPLHGLYGRPGTLLHTFLTSVHAGADDADDRLMAMGQIAFSALSRTGPNWHRAMMLFGPRGSGKSQLVEMLLALMPPDAISAMSPQEIGDPQARHVGDLSGKWLNALTEMSPKFTDGVVFKAVIMGERVRANPKNEKIFEFCPEATHVFAGNELPRFMGALPAIWDRWLPLRFEHHFRDTDRDIHDIGKRIAQEETADLILWALFCGKKLMKDGQYTIPASSAEIFKEWVSDSDPVAYWLETETSPLTGYLENKKSAWPTLADVHKDFKRWTEDAGYKLMGRKMFARRLRDAGAIIDKSGSRVVKIKLCPPPPPDEDKSPKF